ncbi:hypothetical protein ABN028_29085 [Actinopolymorpha sp. B17G11]|uniref:hypothetical protein n=1 Tax=Actinopolymorpha sp. B17G11 TaxID=3160861 RepID=UPI0032E4EE15
MIEAPRKVWAVMDAATLAAARVGASRRGVRRFEFIAPHEASELRATLCGYDRHEAGQALTASAKIYSRWLDDTGAAIERHHEAQKLALQYLRDVIDQASWPLACTSSARPLLSRATATPAHATVDQPLTR